MHDIPNTVYNGAKQLAQLGITCTTVHALGGGQMIKAAKDGLVAGTPTGKTVPKLLAVTELTSISDVILKHEQNCSLPMNDQVISLAKTAKKANADGVICSPLEVKDLRKAVGDDFFYTSRQVSVPKAMQTMTKQELLPQPKQKNTVQAQSLLAAQ